jgi:hypothetical protein
MLVLDGAHDNAADQSEANKWWQAYNPMQRPTIALRQQVQATP